MKEIKLTQGQCVLVDDHNYEWLMQWKWHADKRRHTYYAVRNSEPVNGKRRLILMHREIMHTPSGMETDHIDGNGLNCMEINLRNATFHQNRMNRRKNINGKSKYKGVSYNNNGYIIANIKGDGKCIYLGMFKTEELAAKAYDIAAKKYHKEFARLNFK